ncbi:MAG: DUF2938 domain-containing protein [Mesorhizobium sp.]|uniref:DUF2938 domain-containing protein n=1 Tax=Mesorhizobium sp. TaxID=1871066 RepID=UPI000FE7D42C|nr:DUF2938 domain-containing protein [Mesorhizobium sp.]RWL20435.1 MAG: DUF2938 domain-containing protein [Mesorhizobium sp.]
MNEQLEFVVRAAAIGAGATAVMDLWGLFLKRAFAIPSLDYAWVGRWIGHFPRGRFAHVNIAQAPGIRGETPIGWVAHYAIGIIFAALLMVVWGIDWARHPTLLPALLVGMSSVVAPFFLMQPAFGAGIAAWKTPNPHTARLRSLMTHLSFGVGLYVAALLSALLFPV